MESISVVKRAGQKNSEDFDPEKLRASIMAACLSVKTPIGEAEQLANQVCERVIEWCNQRGEVTSADLRRVAGQVLEKFHAEAAYLYRHHELIV